jgi:hypothetical protein
MAVVVVRGSPRIHVRVNGGERVAGRQTSARSYAPVLILILALARAGLGLRVTQEGIVGRGRVLE